MRYDCFDYHLIWAVTFKQWNGGGKGKPGKRNKGKRKNGVLDLRVITLTNCNLCFIIDMPLLGLCS